MTPSAVSAVPSAAGMYDLLKDFAGPIATVIASVAAILVTYSFNRRQLAVAKAQALTAREQLRYNLFENRYEIYLEARKLLLYLAHEDKRFSSGDHILHYQKLWEAEFFFSEPVCNWLKDLEKDCDRFLVACASGDIEKKRAAQTLLIAKARELLPTFARDLRFQDLPKIR